MTYFNGCRSILIIDENLFPCSIYFLFEVELHREKIIFIEQKIYRIYVQDLVREKIKQ